MMSGGTRRKRRSESQNAIGRSWIGWVPDAGTRRIFSYLLLSTVSRRPRIEKKKQPTGRDLIKGPYTRQALADLKSGRKTTEHRWLEINCRINKSNCRVSANLMI